MAENMIPIRSTPSHEDIQRANDFIKEAQKLIINYRIGICSIDNNLHLINIDSKVLIKKLTLEGWKNLD